ncbi:hypothetical protein J3F84DRAFT_255817 [Trichoderma pleuroticola]
MLWRTKAPTRGTWVVLHCPTPLPLQAARRRRDALTNAETTAWSPEASGELCVNTVAPWRWKFPSGRCGSSKATESSSRHQAPPSLLCSACLLLYGFPPLFSHHHLPLARAKSPDRSPFSASRPLFPRPTLLAKPHRKKKPYLASAHYLLSLFDSSEYCSHYAGHPTTSDGDFPDTYKHESESEIERTAESHCRSFRAPNCDRIHCRRPIAQYSTGDFGFDTLATAHLVTSYLSRGVCRPFVLRPFSS